MKYDMILRILHGWYVTIRYWGYYMVDIWRYDMILKIWNGCYVTCCGDMILRILHGWYVTIWYGWYVTCSGDMIWVAWRTCAGHGIWYAGHGRAREPRSHTREQPLLYTMTIQYDYADIQYTLWWYKQHILYSICSYYTVWWPHSGAASAIHYDYTVYYTDASGLRAPQTNLWRPTTNCCTSAPYQLFIRNVHPLQNNCQ